MFKGLKRKKYKLIMQGNKSFGMHTTTEEMYGSPYMKLKRVRVSSEEFRASRNLKAAKSL